MKLKIFSLSVFILLHVSLLAQNEPADSLFVKKLKHHFLFENGHFGEIVTKDEFFAYSLTFSNGVGFQNGVFLGLGTGVELFDFIQAPVFVDCRYHFNKNKVTPYLFSSLGHSFPFRNKGEAAEDKGGLLFAVGVGGKIPTRKNRAFFFSMGYRYQKIETNTVNSWNDIHSHFDITYRRLFVRIGLFLK